MNSVEFRKAAIAASSKYLEYLEFQEHNANSYAGKSMISVLSICQSQKILSDFLLTLSEKVKYPDSCEIWIRGRRTEKVTILSSNFIGKKKEIVVRVESDCIQAFAKLSPIDVQIVSDLKFLILRLRTFYENNPIFFPPQLPSVLSHLPEPPAYLMDSLSKEQLTAVNGVFSAPVSYIWGAPGTGKTRFVLSRCVLRYILNGKRVLLLAPTNNAVEQMLRGILPELENAGISKRLVYRLGSSSAEFSHEFPEVIGSTALEDFQRSLLQQQAEITEKLSQIALLLSEIAENERQLSLFRTGVVTLNCFADMLSESRSAIQEQKNKKEAAEEAVSVCRSALCSAQENYGSAAAHLHACQSSIRANDALLQNRRFMFWKRTDNKLIQEETTKLLLLIPSLEQDVRQRKEELDAASKSLSEAETAFSLEADRLSELVSDYYSFCNTILTRSYATSALAQYAHQLCDDDSFDIRAEIDRHLVSKESEIQALRSRLPSESVEELKAQLSSITEQLHNLQGSEKIQQKKNALVWAGTIDASLPSIPPKEGLPISHVFLDEAGYTSLARGMTAFSLSCPVTFLGDHKQLPPICEMSRIAPEHQEVCLFSLPIVNYSTVVDGSMDDLYAMYCENRDPVFSSLAKFSLNSSFRFGDQLASVLAKNIYTEQFHGSSNSAFELIILNAPQSVHSARNTSIPEATVIRTYLHGHRSEDIAILAPYKAQVKLLQEMLPLQYRDRISTVHRAQGREWDTVILSVTDTERPYFTNSRLPIGCRVLNTAISRTRHRLIIACDVSCWRKKRGQMIADLIHAVILLDSMSSH